MIKTLIVEDEKRSATMLQQLLQRYCPEVEVVALAQDVQEAENHIRAFSPQLLFLDIELEKNTGFDLLSRYDPIPFSVIFTTAYEQYAIRAFKFNAIDYLLKPIDVEELQASVKRVQEQLHHSSVQENLEAMMRFVRREAKPEKIALSSSRGITMVEIRDIVFCEADGPYTNFHFVEGPPILISRHLKEYEELLGPFGFLRVHHSFLVNKDHIRQYLRGEGGELILQGDRRIRVSRSRKEDLMKWLGTA